MTSVLFSLTVHIFAYTESVSILAVVNIRFTTLPLQAFAFFRTETVHRGSIVTPQWAELPHLLHRPGKRNSFMYEASSGVFLFMVNSISESEEDSGKNVS